MPYVPPEYLREAFNCPFAVRTQEWIGMNQIRTAIA